MGNLAETLWYRQRRPLWPLLPLSWLYQRIARSRRQHLQAAARPLPVPVIVVGNITAGGTGKSPLTAWLSGYLAEQGWRPVILSRGYGSDRPADSPMVVTPDSDPARTGDEPVMLAAQTGRPVVVHPRRLESARLVLEQDLGDLLLCDDGLQHYYLARDLELAVFDGARGIGNGAGLPVGPLREMPERLGEVDFVVVNGEATGPVPAHPDRYAMTLEPSRVRNLATGETQSPDWLQGRECAALAGIGNPQRFFDQLRTLGATVEGREFADHHRYTGRDIAMADNRPLLMTAKDAVKIRSFAHDQCWVLDVEPTLPPGFGPALEQALHRKLTGRGLQLTSSRET
ncbi:tetraacyldisaccharide 4'-kinase [Marinobacter sp. M1N3S26]|uniref:tetraacyldisaccharide 4'-kinase n=1 Tax=Marinobacter sp. M1N3S26 TaxID=3382299 RepID=UPI00387AB5FC